jgi:hypothetical protein
MKYMIWTLGAAIVVFAASCNLLNPTANQVTIEASNKYGGSCPVIANLDGNNAVTIANGTFYTFPLVSPGSHTLNFSTTGSQCSSNCVFQNSGATNNNQNFSTTFNANAGTIYVGTVNGGSNTCFDLVEAGP